jgi:enoyl-CoA hydratase/carnithine racemase
MMGHQRAAELLLLGEPFGAEAAREAGIVNMVCLDNELLETARARARQLAAQPPAAVRLAKSLLKRRTIADLRETIAEEGECFRKRLRSPEATEAMTAFLERRRPDFSRFT